MRAYFIRRFLLIIPTFLGITLLSFVIMQFVPGGPIEKAIRNFRMGAMMKGEGGAGISKSLGSASEIPEEALQAMKEFYGFDKPVMMRYLIWLKNICVLDFGESYIYVEPVMDVITSKFPISIYFGLIGFFLSYSVCIPLGIWKAIRHGSGFDAMSSMIVFIGYSIPGWALGVILLVLFGGGSFWDVFPLGGFRSANYDDLTLPGKLWDQLHHTFLPVFCYMIGSFATETVLMKNALMENLGADYVRTAFAKGLDEKVVIFRHALRNSLITIATDLGHALSLILAGSYLIEKVFNIDGFGLLGYNAIVQRDYPVAMGILVISSILQLTGNIFSDILYCIIDPRVRFD